MLGLQINCLSILAGLQSIPLLWSCSETYSCTLLSIRVLKTVLFVLFIVQVDDTFARNSSMVLKETDSKRKALYLFYLAVICRTVTAVRGMPNFVLFCSAVVPLMKNKALMKTDLKRWYVLQSIVVCEELQCFITVITRTSYYKSRSECLLICADGGLQKY